MCNVRKQICQGVLRVRYPRGQPVRLPLYVHPARKREPVHLLAAGNTLPRWNQEKNPKEVVVGILDRLKNPTQEPISG